jgi:MarR family transcriptional regulator, organic hydroperoxide resistance regulator
MSMLITIPGGDVDDLNYALVRLARRHRYLAGLLLGRLGLHPGQEGVLHLLWERDGRHQAELAAELGVEPATVHRTLGSLERAGFVQRGPMPGDARAKLVRLTDRGRDLRPDLAAAWRELEERTTAGMGDDDRETLLRLLHRAADNLAVPTGDRHPPGRAGATGAADAGGPPG